ncbi:hypothetical protein GOODEAATRI_025947, partial [Goodea atripinnis]
MLGRSDIAGNATITLVLRTCSCDHCLGAVLQSSLFYPLGGLNIGHFLSLPAVHTMQGGGLPDVLWDLCCFIMDVGSDAH